MGRRRWQANTNVKNLSNFGVKNLHTRNTGAGVGQAMQSMDSSCYGQQQQMRQMNMNINSGSGYSGNGQQCHPQQYQQSSWRQ